MTLSSRALAVVPCPSPAPASYEAATPAGFSFRPTARIPDWPQPGPTGFPMSTDGCSSTTLAEWCQSNVAVTPHPSADVRDELLLFFPGKNNHPQEVEHLLFTSAYAGFRTLGLAWDSKEYTRGDGCNTVNAQGDLVLGGVCADDCQFETGMEMLTGVDNPDTPYPAHPMRGVDQRLALALQYLYEKDLNEDNVNDHHWDDFCSYDPLADLTVLAWGDIEVAGFSAGAQMASFVSVHRSPVAQDGIGVFAIEGGMDYCDAVMVGGNPPTSFGVPSQYTDPSYPRCGDTTAPRACPEDNRILVAHTDSHVYPVHQFLQPQYPLIGFSDVSDTTVDALLLANDPVVFDENVFETSHDEGCQGDVHKSMAEDECLGDASGFRIQVDPLAHPTGHELGSPNNWTYEYFLYPAYLKAFCSI